MAPPRYRARRPARALVMAIVAAAVAGLAAACTSAPPAATPSVDRVGLTVFAPANRQSVPNLSGKTLAGRQFALRAVLGRVVVVNVWASWCTECRAESPLLARMSRRLMPREIAFVGIDERDDPAAARRFAAGAGAHYPELSDPDSRLLALLPQLPQMGIPSTLVVDRTGRAAARIIGAVHPGELRRALGAAERNG